MKTNPNGVLLFWNGKWFQIHNHNDTEEVVIHEISESVVSVYEKRKYKDKVYEAFIPSFQNQTEKVDIGQNNEN